MSLSHVWLKNIKICLLPIVQFCYMGYMAQCLNLIRWQFWYRIIRSCSHEAELILSAQQSLSAPDIRNQLAFRKANFSFLVGSITELQATGLHLSKSLQIMQQVKDHLTSLNDTSYPSKCQKIVYRNKMGCITIQAINRILEGKSFSAVQKLHTNDLPLIQSFDDERTFSMY